MNKWMLIDYYHKDRCSTYLRRPNIASDECIKCIYKFKTMLINEFQKAVTNYSDNKENE